MLELSDSASVVSPLAVGVSEPERKSQHSSKKRTLFLVRVIFNSWPNPTFIEGRLHERKVIRSVQSEESRNARDQ